jgi:hypothetical protein
MEKKTFKLTDKSGRSIKPYVFDKEHIEENWDLLEEDWNEQTLGDYLDESYIGDVWETSEVKIECIKIINN